MKSKLELLVEDYIASSKENERILNEKFAETDRLFKETREDMKETDRRMKETDRRMKELQQTVGGWSNSHGFFAEEYFINSFKKGKKNFLGEKFDKFMDHVKPVPKKEGYEDEYDMMLINGKTVGIIEAKFKLRRSDIPQILRKAETFRVNCHEYAHLNVYLGVAALTFDPVAKQECLKKGIAIIKQVGDTVVIIDEHLKVF